MYREEPCSQAGQQVTWPLIGSLILTGVAVAMVCVPPFPGLKSWGHLLGLACVYMLVAAFVHALAVWSVYRIQREGVREWALVWPVVWGAWTAVVWLPLIALLTYEHSTWVALILPVAAMFLTLFVVSRRRVEQCELPVWMQASAMGTRPEMFAVDESPRLWRALLPSLTIALVLDGGIAMMAASHAWMAAVRQAVEGKKCTGFTYCARACPLPLLPSGPGGVGGCASRRTRHTS